ncbi:MAG: hypothetical protein GWP05_00410 [Anaerolineaceae bacterium]|nr:hypothetical protein [Anaerolineaceae bacterium]
MKILILRSERRPSGDEPQDPYTQVFSSHYADRVIGNLKSEDSFCASCGPDCISCRRPYERGLADRIAGVIAFPPLLPYLLEKPAEYVPRELPPHDILLAINIHEQILAEMVRACARQGTRGVVVPLEATNWISRSARQEVIAICRDGGLEVAFPKPFCNFDPPGGSLLAEFQSQFHIGHPKVDLEVEGGIIKRAQVAVSAACGATYYVARWLVGETVDEDLKYRVISMRMHSYPCTASMKWDRDLDDSPLHVAGQAHYEILAPLQKGVRREAAMVVAPMGRTVHKAVPMQENLDNIERAKGLILEALQDRRAVTLEDLRKNRSVTPAALDSALVILRQEGQVRADKGRISPAPGRRRQEGGRP